MKKLIILLSAILIVTSACFAQENMGARPIGMGGAFTGLADDANAIFANPAGVSNLKDESAILSTKISGQNEYTVIGWVEETPFGNLGIGYISSSSHLDNLVSSSSLTDLGNTPVKELNQTLVLSYGRALNEIMVVPDSMGTLSFGANIKFASSKVNTANGLSYDQGSGFDADLAAIYKANDAISLGLSYKDLLSEGREFRVGASGKVFGDTLTWSIENENIGFELKPFSVLALRAGKNGEYRTAGVGVSVNGFGVDYAYLAKDEPVHYVAISIAIDRAEEPDTRQASLINP